MTHGQVPPDPIDPFNGAVSSINIANNVISSNLAHGILLSDNTLNSYLSGNWIGVDASLTSTSLGNGGNGIYVGGSYHAPCIGNIIGASQANNIMYNQYGIVIDGDLITSDTLNPIVGNANYNNVFDGIRLLSNGNNMQIVPTIVNALINADGNSIIIAVTAPAIPASSMYRIDFFINSIDRTPITEGRQYVGSLSSLSSGSTAVVFYHLPATVSSNVWVSATATNFNGPPGSLGDTSPYAPNFPTQILTTNLPAIMFQ